jgi:hypothetical protein
MTEEAYEVALPDPSGAELLGASTAAKLEDQIVVLRADVDLAASLRVLISSACGSQAWNGCDSHALRAQPKKARDLWRRTRSWSQRRQCFANGVLGVSQYNYGQS